MYCDCPIFKRCCFCLPLRRGVILFGYINVLFSSLILALYSYHVSQSHDYRSSRPDYLVYHGVLTRLMGELCVAVYCVEVFVSGVLVYGGHKGNIICLKIFYYYAITTTLMSIVFQLWEIIEVYSDAMHPLLQYVVVFTLGSFSLSFCGLCIQVYLIITVRSLVKKLDTSNPHQFENQIDLALTRDPETHEDVFYNNNTSNVEPYSASFDSVQKEI